MCGIAGIFDLRKNKKISKQTLLSMCNSMVHRGPDDSGIVILNNLGLGHRRLSIIDLSKKGRQPMSDDKKEIWIVFNGEIYNFREIKDELIKKNYNFKSKSDTEVIIYAYKEWGIDCIKKFNGMFSFALFDVKKNELFLVRDRLGIKPLYYTKINNSFIFSSEIKAILKYVGFKKEVNIRAVSSYLSYRYVIGNETLFKNIFKLLPGHYMSIKKGKIAIKKYWDINLSENRSLKEKDCKREVKRLLNKAVELRMISDVPVGAYLSGGIDSSVIVALMTKLSDKKVKTFTIGFKEQGYNEFYYSKQVAEMYKTSHKEILLSEEDYLKTMKKLIKYKDSPLSVPNEVPIYLMSKELKKDITVVLSGEGADEIFGGYGRLFRSPFDYKKMKMMKHFPLFLRKKLFKHLTVKYGNKEFKSELDHFLYNYSYFPIEEKKFIFNDQVNNIVGNDENLRAIFNGYFERARKASYYKKIGYVFEKVHLPGLLAKLDCPTMATSVEGRVPFVDHNLVEFMFKVPEKYKMKWKSFADMLRSLKETSDHISEKRDTPKYLLKESFRDILPEEVVERKKKGFPVPLDIWFRGGINKLAKKELLNSNSRIRLIVNQKNLKKWIDANLKNKSDNSFGQKLWMLLNLEYWLREYF